MLHDKDTPQTPPERWVIDVTFHDEGEALRARDAIEKLLCDMGQIGTLSFWSDHETALSPRAQNHDERACVEERICPMKSRRH